MLIRAVVAASLVVVAAVSIGAIASEDVQPGTSQIRITSRVVDTDGGRKVTLALYNKAVSPSAIGSGVLLCTKIGGGPFVSRAQRCEGSYRLAHGTVEVEGVVSSMSFYTLAVVGGTGLYANAGAGELTAFTTGLRPRTERLVFVLYAL